jgi:hypothetical protein
MDLCVCWCCVALAHLWGSCVRAALRSICAKLTQPLQKVGSLDSSCWKACLASSYCSSRDSSSACLQDTETKTKQQYSRAQQHSGQ